MTKLPPDGELAIEQAAKADDALDKNPNSTPYQRLMLEQFRSPRRLRELAQLVSDGLLDHAPVPRRKQGYGRLRPSPLDVVAYDARRISVLCRANDIRLPRGKVTAVDVALEQSLRIAGISVSDEEREALVGMVSWRKDHRSGSTGAQRNRRKKSRAKL